MNLDGRVVIVTGGSGDLGRAYSKGLALRGASVVVADLQDPAPVVEEIEKAGGTAVGVPIDVTDPDSLDRMARSAVDAFGKIDALVNNAGYYTEVQQGPLEDITIEEWDRSFAINVRGTWLATRAVVPHMKAAGYGHVINVASGTCYRPNPGTGFPHYISAKSAVIGLTRALAVELGDFGIAVNTLVPDLIPNEAFLRTKPERNEKIVTQRCFKRTEKPEDMVGTVVFLCSSASDFITGQSLLVNGGNILH